ASLPPSRFILSGKPTLVKTDSGRTPLTRPSPPPGKMGDLCYSSVTIGVICGFPPLPRGSGGRPAAVRGGLGRLRPCRQAHRPGQQRGERLRPLPVGALAAGLAEQAPVVEAVRAAPADDLAGALVEFQAHLAGDVALGGPEEPLQGAAQVVEPQPGV